MKTGILIAFFLLLYGCGKPVQSTTTASSSASSSSSGTLDQWNWLSGLDGLNYTATSAVRGTTSIATFSNKIYVAWAEQDPDTVYQIRVAVFNGDFTAPSWTFVDGNGVEGLNYDEDKSANSPHLCVFNSKLYLTWIEQITGGYAIHASIYGGNDASPTWTSVDGSTETGIDSGTTITKAHLVSFNSKLYLFWDNEHIQFAVYNGNDTSPTWTVKSGSSGLDFNGEAAAAPKGAHAVVFASKLYATWLEMNAQSRLVPHVAVYNGNDSFPVWTFVDGNRADGLAYNIAASSGSTFLTAGTSTLYLFYETNNTSAINQLRALAYNGNDSSASWDYLDGGVQVGINYDVTKNVAGNQYAPIDFGGHLYAFFGQVIDNTANRYLVGKMYNDGSNAPAWSTVTSGIGPLLSYQSSQSSTIGIASTAHGSYLCLSMVDTSLSGTSAQAIRVVCTQ